jgi:hypothetical protein
VTVLTGILVVETAIIVSLLTWCGVLPDLGQLLVWVVVPLLSVVALAIAAVAFRRLYQRRFRFGLRMMFALTSLAALVSWWLAVNLPKYTQEWNRNRALAIVGKYHNTGSHVQWLDTDDPLLPSRLNFYGSRLTDRELPDLAGHPNLTSLNLRRSLVSDDGMASLLRFQKLASVDVSETNVTALGISQLRRLPTLKMLTLDGNQLRQLATVPNQELPLVHQLWLDSERIDDNAISDLERWEHLDHIAVVRGAITDNGMAELSRVSALRSLLIMDCPGVTDTGLMHLKHHQHLQFLQVVNTGVTPDGGATLQKCLPDCVIEVRQGRRAIPPWGPASVDGNRNTDQWETK